MVADFNSVNNQLNIPTDLFKNNQQNFAAKNQNKLSQADQIKNPSDDRIAELVEFALNSQKKGNVFDRGSIVNILA